MAVPPEYLLFPGINSFGHDLRSDLHPCGGAFASSPSTTCHRPLHKSPSPPSSDFILQSEPLMMELAKQRRQKTAVLLKILEAKAGRSMREKERYLKLATKRTRELEARLIKTELASKSWRMLAKEKEATMAELKSVLQRVRENLAGDAESSCEAVRETNKKKMVCRVCHDRSSCVLLLPCRHVCSCEPCEPCLASCPVCQSRKEASMKVFFVGTD